MVTTPSDKPMMKCGHAANATREGEPVCVVCIGVDPGATVIDTAPDLTGRVARCSYAKGKGDRHRGGGQYAVSEFDSTRPSSTNLAFFKAQPDQAEDSFYCGCWGWD